MTSSGRFSRRVCDIAVVLLVVGVSGCVDQPAEVRVNTYGVRAVELADFDSGSFGFVDIEGAGETRDTAGRVVAAYATTFREDVTAPTDEANEALSNGELLWRVHIESDRDTGVPVGLRILTYRSGELVSRRDFVDGVQDPGYPLSPVARGGGLNAPLPIFFGRDSAGIEFDHVAAEFWLVGDRSSLEGQVAIGLSRGQFEGGILSPIAANLTALLESGSDDPVLAGLDQDDDGAISIEEADIVTDDPDLDLDFDGVAESHSLVIRFRARRDCGGDDFSCLDFD